MLDFSASANAVGSAASFAAASARAVVVDESAPSTIIQVVLADMSKIRQKFNLTHTVLDIYEHVQLCVHGILIMHIRHLHAHDCMRTRYEKCGQGQAMHLLYFPLTLAINRMHTYTGTFEL